MGINKRLILGCGIILVTLILTDIIVSSQTKKPSQVAKTLQNIQDITSDSEDPFISPPAAIPTPVNLFVGLPKSYKSVEITTDLYKQAHLKYRNTKPEEVKLHIIDTIQQYYVYNTYLAEQKIPYAVKLPLSWNTVEYDVPFMKNLVEKNLISYMDFAYIKARFKYAPEEERIKTIYGDIKVKARQLLENYQKEFSVENPNIAQIVDASNVDVDLMILNNNEKNGVLSNYTPAEELFFTDKKFNTFLFSQKQGVVSSLYTLHGSAGDEYAYVIVYPIFVQTKEFKSTEDLINAHLQYFKKHE